MKKTITCVLLILCIINAMMISAMAAQADTAIDMSLSEAGVRFIEAREGYSKFANKVSTQYYIGYGTKCDIADYPAGISEEEAELLLLDDLKGTIVSINSFLAKQNVAITQQQFDALVSFTYNLGTGWMSTSSRIYNYLIDGVENHSDIEIVNAIGTWCHVGKAVVSELVERRLAEGNLFLYGDYEGNTHDYRYVTFNAGSGSVDYSIIFYENGLPYGELQKAKWNGYIFNGWYTGSGNLLTADICATENLAVVARWSDIASLSLSSLYCDVTENDWFYTYVNDLSQSKVIGGYPDGSFQPNNAVSYGEALKLVLLASGYDAQAPVDSNWASGYLKLAVSKQFIDQKEVTGLDEPINRLQVAQIAAKALGLSGTGIINTPFADTSDGYVLSLYQQGIVEGSNENNVQVYKPNDSLCRSEISAIVWRLNNAPGDTTDEPANDTDTDNADDAEYIQFGKECLDILEGVPVNSYDAAAFYSANGIMNYNSEELKTSIGIDVSSYQGVIDWQKVKNAGMEYAIIRVGFRGYVTGSMNLDAYFETNIRGALAAGLKVGVYFFSQAVTVEEAREEAQFVLSNIQGYDISFPVVFDWENIGTATARTDGLDTETLDQCATTFCSMIQNAGYTPMIYFNSYIGYLKYDLSKILEYDFWLAQYAAKPTFYYDFQMWQYTSGGTVDGISGSVDMNICLTTY